MLLIFFNTHWFTWAGHCGLNEMDHLVSGWLLSTIKQGDLRLLLLPCCWKGIVIIEDEMGFLFLVFCCFFLRFVIGNIFSSFFLAHSHSHSHSHTLKIKYSTLNRKNKNKKKNTPHRFHSFFSFILLFL